MSRKLEENYKELPTTLPSLGTTEKLDLLYFLPQMSDILPKYHLANKTLKTT